MLGKYGAMVAIRTKDNKPLSEENRDLGRQLCQHVVGKLSLSFQFSVCLKEDLVIFMSNCPLNVPNAPRTCTLIP